MSRVAIEQTLRNLVMHAWEDEVRWPHIEAWAKNFQGNVADPETEQLHALFALTRFMYFGKRLVREMLRALYRDHFEAPLIQRIRRNLGGTRDQVLLRALLEEEVNSTRFLGVGNPAESGAHLLYYFRQVNYLAKDLFIDLTGAFAPRVVRAAEATSVVYEPRESGISRYVFFDDLVGSGSQATEYLSGRLAAIRRGSRDIELRFMSLFATTKGLERMNAPGMFDGNAMSLFELDDTFKAFGAKSRYFASAPDWFSDASFRALALHYGNELRPGMAMGYGDGQLMLGFTHNTPDNTLPIFWDEGSKRPWSPVLLRYDKVY